jgi:hypothetical protein
VDSLKAGNRSCLHYKVRSSRPLAKPESKAKTSTTAQPKATDLPRSRRQDSSLARFPQFSADRIKETDPYRIKLLWREVTAPKMAPKEPSYLRPTKSSNLKKEAYLNKPSPSLEDSATGSSTPETSTVSSSKKQSLKNATVRDPDFEDTQLIPRGLK